MLALLKILKGAGMNDLKKIPCMLMRGGTSKGPFFLDEDLPKDKDERYKLLIRAMGSPDIRQIDGIGGATFVTSKSCIVSPSSEDGIDVDYKFVQVSIEENSVDDKPTCGNILSAVGVFALERGLVKIKDGKSKVVIRDVNTGAKITQIIQTPNKIIQYKGDFKIAGVPFPASPVKLKFQNIAGGKTGSCLPTGNKIDTFDGVKATCLDISMPVVFVKAGDMGISGYETPQELEQNRELFSKLESIREKASHAMGLGNAKGNVIPKFCTIAKGKDGGDICIRYFTPASAHPAVAVSASFNISTALFIKGTIFDDVSEKSFTKGSYTIKVENPSGINEVGLNFPTDNIEDVEGEVVRSARLLFKGDVYV